MHPGNAQQGQQVNALPLSHLPTQHAQPVQINANSGANMPAQTSVEAVTVKNGANAAAQSAVLQGNADASTAVPNGVLASPKRRSKFPVATLQAYPEQSNSLPVPVTNMSTEEVKNQGNELSESAPPVNSNSAQELPHAEATEAQAKEADTSAKQIEPNQQNLHMGLHEDASQKAFSDAFLA